MFETTIMPSRSRLILRFAPILLAFPLVLSAGAKLAGTPEMIDNLTRMGYAEQIRLIGFLELLTALCYAIPLTRTIGFFLLNAYLGGALAAELAATVKAPLPALFMLILAWVLMASERPQWMFGALYRSDKEVE